MKRPPVFFLFSLMLLISPAAFVSATESVETVAGSSATTTENADLSEVVDKGETIDVLAIKDMDIREVIELIARKSGLSIVTGQNVMGRATIFLKDVNARDALRMVLEANGLAFADEGGIIRVMTASEYQSRFGYAFGQEKVTKMVRIHFASPLDLGILLNEMKSEQGKVIVNEEGKNIVIMDTAEKVRAMEGLLRDVDVQTIKAELPLKYAKAQDVVEELRGMLTQSIGSVECDTAANKIVVTDTPAKVGKIRSALERMDSLGRRIMVQARLVHVVLNSEHLGGVDWSGIVEEYRNLRLWGNYDFLDGEAEERVLSLGTIAEDDFSTLLEALDTVGIIKEYPLADLTLTQADAVKVAVRMDDPSLDLSRVRVEEAVESDGNAVSGGVSFEFFLRMAIDAENKVEATVVPHESRPPRKTKRLSAHTAAVVAGAGKTVVLGGLIATEKIATTRKIPLMGDLPLLGFAFRFHDSSVRREEFIVFLTPKILNGETKGEAKSASAGGSDVKAIDEALSDTPDVSDKEKETGK